jgi:FAD/FMN-containing dehydrogenase/Fe-S oxidoreductase
MTMSETIAHNAPRRVVRPAARGTREAAEFVPFPAASADALARALAARISGEVRFGSGDRALYATDGSNYRQVPIGVVVPKSVEDVIETVRLCREFRAPFLSRGGGTSLAGQCCNTAVVVDYSKYLDHVLTIDAERRVAWVEPGTVLDTLRQAAERYHLTFAPDPSTHDHNSLGGMIGNNSCGVHSVMGGRTVDNVRELDILTYDGLRMRVGPTSDAELKAIIAAGGRRGEIYRKLDALRRRYADTIRQRFPQIPRRVSGYNLDALLPENGFDVARALVGSEGTCVVVLKAGLKLVPSPPERVLVVIGFPDIYTAGDAVPQILTHRPIGLEGIDEELVDDMKKRHLHPDYVRLLPEGCGWLVVEFGGETEAEAIAKAEALKAALPRIHGAADARVISDKEQQKHLWKVREAGLGATAYLPGKPDAWEGWEDSAVPPARVGDYLRDLKALYRKYDYDSAVYGHFGDGCIHCRIDFGLRTEAGVAKWRRFLTEASDLVLSYGGSNSGEHGDGEARGELLVKMFGPELMQAFREFKAIWDPDGLMNPGKVIDPFPITANLRLGPDYRPPRLKTHFHFRPEGGGFHRAAQRCVGVGLCRRHGTEDGVMCPSYQVTHEEKYSTRGRAHLLFEMMHGGVIEDGWKSDAVEEALSLCLSCKGCKKDCPVNVDMATYKAEFRSHYYAGRLRPRSAYSMGLIHLWSRVANRMPGLANFLTQTPGINALVKAGGGIAQKRRMPAFARRSFRQWFAAHAPKNPNGPPVILFPDTFNNFFRPETAINAVHVLESLGWHVTVPPRVLCCGRPLYDWGMLHQAKSLLKQVVTVLKEPIAQGVPIVGLEPACVVTFRDELLDLFPEDEAAQRLGKQFHILSEFLDRHAQHIDLPKLQGKALVQIHCNQHAVLETDPERRMLERLGLECEVMPSGCCGMAGSFGFEAEKYDLSMKAAERVMLPTVRRADAATFVVANGFSCREQIEQGSSRRTRHLADVLAEAIGVAVDEEVRSDGRAPSRGLLLAGGALALGLAAGVFMASRPAFGRPDPEKAGVPASAS